MIKILFTIYLFIFLFIGNNAFALKSMFDKNPLVNTPGCNKEYKPVCGEINSVQKVFHNLCLLKAGKTAVFINDGECKEKIPSPADIKYYKNVERRGNSLWGNRIDNKEKIPNPSEIKNYTNIEKRGSSLWGIRVKK